MRIEKYYIDYCSAMNKKCEISIELDIEPYVPDIPDNYKIISYYCPDIEDCKILDTCPMLLNFRKNFYNTR